MIQNNDLTQGNIFKALIKLALPIMGTSFIQMAYNMIDMIWIGKLGSEAVAAVGTAGFFTWLAMAFIFIPKIGAEVSIAQSIGKKDIDSAKHYALYTIQLTILLSLSYGFCLLLFRKSLIGFFNLGDMKLINMSIDYLIIISCGIVFFFINPVLTGILNGYGDSKTPFIINTIGLIGNIILDPVLILGFGPVPALGVKGAAIATIFSQFIVTMVFIYKLKDLSIFSNFHLFSSPDLNYIKIIAKLGLPVALQSGLFTIFSMCLARIVANWGATPIAVQKVGSQIEAISWMSASGFSTALSTFVGQNYGANRKERIFKGYFSGIGIVSVIGLLATYLLLFKSQFVFSIFISEREALRLGIDYLQILSFSQLFICAEITTTGAFNGIGKTIPPSIVGITLNALRIPLSIILSSSTYLGLNGVWWSISITGVLKGVILVAWFIFLLYKHPKLQYRFEL